MRPIQALLLPAALFVLEGCAGTRPNAAMSADTAAIGNRSRTESLRIGESFALTSKILGEERRINVFTPTIYGQKFEEPLPVLYMLDGGIDEDFLHIAGLVQVLTSNGGMRPHLLVGIQNTQRRRDMTGPTDNPEDRKIAPVVGGSAVFRSFIREELKLAIRSRYRTTDQSAIVGESLAGLFVVETLLREPELFDTYIAIDPSLWWNSNKLVIDVESQSATASNVGEKRAASLFVAQSSEETLRGLTDRFVTAALDRQKAGFSIQYFQEHGETHATIYHPAALRIFPRAFAPVNTSTEQPVP